MTKLEFSRDDEGRYLLNGKLLDDISDEERAALARDFEPLAAQLASLADEQRAAIAALEPLAAVAEAFDSLLEAQHATSSITSHPTHTLTPRSSIVWPRRTRRICNPAASSVSTTTEGIVLRRTSTGQSVHVRHVPFGLVFAAGAQ